MDSGAHRKLDGKQRRFLVLGRVGDQSVHQSWVADSACERTWDLLLSVYGEDPTRFQQGDFPPIMQPGTKWDILARYLTANPDLFDRYDYIMLPDDDVLMSAGDINRLFEIMAEYDLSIAQPALSLESYISWPILLRCPSFRLRYTNFLESMACCFKASYLKSLLPMLERHHTGWGTDLVWTMLMDDPAFRSAVIDEVPMTHTRPLYSGPLYDKFVKSKIDPKLEVEALTGRFANYPRKMLAYGGVLMDGRRAGSARTQLLNGLHLLGVAGRSKLPRNTARMGAAMLLRMVTKAGYRPEQLRPKANAVPAEAQSANG